MLNFDIQLFADGDHSTIDTANEKNIKITRLDNASGDLTVLYPITKIDNVEGLEEALKKTLSPYDATSTYAVGDIVINPDGDGIYKCTTAIQTAEAWTEGHWTLIATKNYTNLTNKPTIPTDTWRNVQVKGTQILGTGTNTGALNFAEGSNVTLTASNGTVTIAATDTNQTITAKNNGTGSAVTFGANAPVELVQGSNVTITADDTNNKITIAAKDTTYESKAAASGGTDVSLVTTGEKYTWNNKQDALQTQTAYTSKGSATKVPQITTNTLGQVTNITEVTITDNNDNQTVKGNGTTFGVNAPVDIVGSGLIGVVGNNTANTITISTTAQANVLEGVQLNGEDLPISSKKANVQVGVSQTDSIATASVTQDSTTKAITINIPNSKGSGLAFDYNSGTGVLSLVDTAHPVGTPLSAIDLPLELMVESGYYDSTTENLVLVLANYEQSNPQPTSSTFKQNYYYTKSGDTYTLASSFASGTTYYNHSEIKIPVADLITEYEFDSNYFSTTRVVDGHTVISSSLIGYVDLSGKTPDSYVLTDSEFAEVQKNVCFIKYIDSSKIYILYKEKSFSAENASIRFNSVLGCYKPYSQANYYQISSARIAISSADKTFGFSLLETTTYTQVGVDKALNGKISQNEIADNLSTTYIMANPQPTSETFYGFTYYTRIGGAEPYTYTLATSWASGNTYYVRAVPSVSALNTALDAKLDDTQLKTSWSSTVSDSNIPSEKLVKDSLDAKLDDSQLKTSWSSTVSDSNIPSEKLVKDSLDAKLDDSQLVTSWQSTHSDTKIPSEKLVATTKQDTLVSGTNIKTINNTSLLGSGNINTTSVTFVDWS